MSRLDLDDDELRRALRRKEPPAGFAERVLQRIAAEPAGQGQAGWWRALVNLFQPPKVRWVVIGVAVTLMLALVGYEYLAVRDARSGKAPVRTADVNGSGSIDFGTPEETAGPPSQNLRKTPEQVAPVIERQKAVGVRRAVKPRAPRPEAPTMAEAKKAKEQLLVALQIASATLNEAQRLVQGDTQERERGSLHK